MLFRCLEQCSNSSDFDSCEIRTQAIISSLATVIKVQSWRGARFNIFLLCPLLRSCWARRHQRLTKRCSTSFRSSWHATSLPERIASCRLTSKTAFKSKGTTSQLTRSTLSITVISAEMLFGECNRGYTSVAVSLKTVMFIKQSNIQTVT